MSSPIESLSDKASATVHYTPLGTESPKHCNSPKKSFVKSSMFGFIPDAFAGKSLDFGLGSGSNTPTSSRTRRNSEESNKSNSTTSKDGKVEINNLTSTSLKNAVNGHSSEKPLANGTVTDAPETRPIGVSPTQSIISDVESVLQMETVNTLSASPIFTSAQSRILIKGGRIVNDDLITDADIYIEDGIIKQIGVNLAVPGGIRTIDAHGKLLIPGGVDPHTHFQLPVSNTTTADDFYSGTKAALAGGTTTIIDYVVARKGESLIEMYDKWRSWADEKVCCDYGLHAVVTTFTPEVQKEMEILTNDKGVNSYKMYMSDKGDLMIKDDVMLSIFDTCKHIGALGMIHAENGDAIATMAARVIKSGVNGPEGHEQSRPEETEEEATIRAITLADQVNCPVYIVNVMGIKSANVIANKKKEGAICFGEALAAALGTDGSHCYDKCWRHAAGYVLSPPLRSDPVTPGFLMDMLSSDNLQVTASDNRTFNADQKAVGKDDFRKIPAGANGVEDRMSVVWEKGVVTGKLDPCKFVAVTSTNAAKIFNIYPRKGRIAVGSDADIVFWNPNATRVISAKTHHQSTDFNIFEGLTCHGVAECVISNGRIVVEDGQVKVSQGSGRFIPTPPFSPHFYMKVNEREKVKLPKKVLREAYIGNIADPSGEVVVKAKTVPLTYQQLEKAGENPICPLKSDDFYNRPPTTGGCRNQQDSSFAFSGAQVDDRKAARSTIKVHNPPGGKSSGLW